VPQSVRSERASAPEVTLRYGFPMIHSEFVCDHRYLTAFSGCERWAMASGMSEKPYPRG
jgi:hypothetical protein